MKREVKKILFVIFSLFLLLSGLNAQAVSTCSWDLYTQAQYVTPSCPQAKKQAENSNSCTQPRPADTTYGGYLCCCSESDPLAHKPTPPKFVMPELQVSIPGLTLTPANSLKYNMDSDGNYSVEIPWLSEYIIALYNYGLSIAGILAAIVLMAGGVLWLTSGGDASRMNQAKELIAGSVAGIIVLFCSYIILYQINPDLVNPKAITLGGIKGLETRLAQVRDSDIAGKYKNMACASDAELAAGVDFYATGYYKPAWEDSDTFRCVVAMQCSCPNGKDNSKNCDKLYGKTYPGYHPCNPFPSTTSYCDKTSSGSAPQIGDIAGPSDCQDNLATGTTVCFKGKTYTIRDTGGGIKGRRIDIWNGTSLQDALNATGVGKLTKGPCK